MMKQKIKKPIEIDSDLADRLIFSILPQKVLSVFKSYFRLECLGLENLPKRGRGIVIPNHSGFTGLDALLLGHEIFTHTGRIPRLMAHRFWFSFDFLTQLAKKYGLVKASTENGLTFLNKNQLIVLFPEGESGNFKPTKRRYRLQEFKTGFVRMAMLTNSPLIPTLIIGAEESQINLAKLKLPRFLSNGPIPLPLNLLPFPTKWKIIFLEPIHLPFSKESANDSELVSEICSDIQEQMQFALNKELFKRENIF
jgi:1-acyl-sn-glycerol-3-phosphate acyltransferase